MKTTTPAMKFGLSGCGGGFEADQPASWIEYARKAEEAGFEGLWINEEHFNRTRACPSPIVLASALAAATRSIRVGFSVLLLPLHNPIRLAEELATLDQLSQGRIDIGISRGGNLRYFQAYGVDLDPREECFERSLASLLRLMSEDEALLPGGPVSIQPKPFQKPWPPVYIGTYTEDRAFWAGRTGYGLIQHGIQRVDHLRSVLRAFASGGGKIEEVPVGRFLYVSQSDRLAAEEILPVVEELTAFLQKIQIYKQGVLLADQLEPKRFLREMVIAGSPTTVIERIWELKAELGIAYLNGLVSFFGRVPGHLLRKSLQLFSWEVLPAFRSGC